MQYANNTSCICFAIWEIAKKKKNLSLGKPTYGEKGRCTFMRQLAKWFKVCLLNGEKIVFILEHSFSGERCSWLSSFRTPYHRLAMKVLILQAK